jgi:hypothetical protein
MERLQGGSARLVGLMWLDQFKWVGWVYWTWRDSVGPYGYGMAGLVRDTKTVAWTENPCGRNGYRLVYGSDKSDCTRREKSILLVIKLD